MKNILLLISLTLSPFASAQNIHSSLDIYHQAPGPMENFRYRTENETEKISELSSHENFELFQSQKPAQLNSVQLNDSIHTWRWDNALYEWTIDSKITPIEYDENNNLLYFISQEWEEDEWTNSYKDTYTYDLNNNTTSYLRQLWNNDLWWNWQQDIYTYDSNNNLTSKKTISEWNNKEPVRAFESNYTYDANKNIVRIHDKQFKNGSWRDYGLSSYTYDAKFNQTEYVYQQSNGATWINTHKYTYTYDINNNKISVIFQNGSGISWVNSNQYTYSYDVNYNQTRGITQYWNGSEWVNSNQFTYSYDANNNQIREINQNWDMNEWVNYYQDTSSYDINNNKTWTVGQNWDGISWENSDKIIYAYDANNNQTSNLVQHWNSNRWVNFVQFTNSYDSNNFLESETTKFFDTANMVQACVFLGRIVCSDSTHYYFHEAATSIKDLNADDGSFTVYPNPGNGKFTISSKNSFNTIEVYNLLGERIYADNKFNQLTSYNFDLSGQAKGIYFVNIYDGTIMYNCKVIVQ